MKSATLILKSLAGILFLLVTMGAALFVPYGSLQYPLAWWYVALFGASIVLITFYLILFDQHLLKSRITAGPASEKRPVQQLIQSVAGIAFLGIFVVSALDQKHKWSYVQWAFSYAALLFCAAAFVWLFFVFKQNTFLSATVEVQERQQVISTGLYGIVRHPMYTGVLILLLFTPPALGSFAGLAAVGILILVIVYRTLDEEKELKQNLPGYHDYCRKVHYRLIPFVF